MASQAVLFAETIAGMKRAIKRKAYDSDSDESIEGLTNRGNKLKKKARYVHEGQLAPPSGPLVYKRKIIHAGYEREIISRNPPLIDEDGYEVDSDDDDERAQAAIASAAELDPYADVKLEHLLAPLTAASDLPNHPTLALPFTSKVLTELTRQARQNVQKENATLWKIKHLLTKLSGDNTWIPCESVEAANDIELFFDEWESRHDEQNGKGPSKFDPDQLSTGTLQREDEARNKDSTADADPLIHETAKSSDVALISSEIAATHTTAAEDVVMTDRKSENDVGENIGPRASAVPDQHTDSLAAETGKVVDTVGSMVQSDEPLKDGLEGGDVEGTIEDQDEVSIPRRMRTRAQAHAASDNTATSRTRSMTPDSSAENLIHPYFLAPPKSHPDRDLGLPPQEAEETRRILLLFIQKQEEVCRGTQKVYEGLLRADRMRHLVMKWAKAEGHVGEDRGMSDGEDWYDKEEWGLTEDLKKGQDEEEEDAATTAKKTRTRRQ